MLAWVHSLAVRLIPETKASPVLKVAIACQGGGSHAAFAAGVLQALLAPKMRERFDLVALSGTSGGAMCAALAWAGLVRKDPDDAVDRLSRFWRDLEVHDLLDAVANFWGVVLARMPAALEISPYAYEPVAAARLKQLLSRHLAIETLPSDPRRRGRPKLFLGATDIVSGERTIFEGETLTYDDLIASAAIPPLYRAVRAHGSLFWDGLFTTNPPVREFTDLPKPERPDEIWVVQINPQCRAGEPRTMRDIADRRNELSGNLSLGQELYFVDRINKLLDEHSPLAKRYKPICVRVVQMGISDLDYPSKLDRTASLIERLMRNGEERAAWFFDERSLWPRKGTVPARPAFPARAASAGQ
jgi:NTE family protein